MPDPQSNPTPERILQMAFGYAPPLILEAAIRNRVFDLLDDGPRSISEIGAQTGASERGLTAIANALVALGFLVKAGDSQYALTPESSTFLVSRKPAFQGGLLRHTSTQLLPRWLHLNEIVTTGKPYRAVNDSAHGEEFFQNFVADLLPLNFPGAKVLAEHLRLSEKPEPKVLDLAAGSGVWSIALAQSAPAATVTAVDFPAVLQVTRQITSRFGVADRYRYLAGDILEVDLGAGYTVATLGHILHSEGEVRSRRLLQRVFDALAPGGTIAIAEYLVNADRSGPAQGAIFAVNMLVNTEEGTTFSFEEIRGWLTEIGFEPAYTVQVPAPSPLVLATKPA